MSIKLMSRVYEKDIDASLQRVLLVLCDYANDEGTNCYPSIDRIAWKLGANRKTVMRAIQRAEQLGAIGVHREHRHNNRYTIHLDALEDKQPFDVESQNGTQGKDAEGPKKGPKKGLKGTQGGTQRDPNGDAKGPHPPVYPPTKDISPDGEASPTKSANTKRELQPDEEIVQTWADICNGGAWPVNAGIARKHAKALVKAGFTPEEAGRLIEWLRRQAWIKGGIDLNLMISQADKFRSANRGGTTARRQADKNGGLVLG